MDSITNPSGNTPSRRSNNPSGRPPSASISEQIVATFWKMLDSVPYGSITMERLALQAGVSRASLYRRHKSVSDVAFAALLHAGAQQVVMTTTDDLFQDLHAYLRSIVISLDRDGKVGKAFRILLATAQVEDAMVLPFYNFLNQRREPVRLRLAACDVGLSASQIDYLLDQLFGPILYRLLIRNTKVDDHAIIACVQPVVDRLTLTGKHPK